jgi:hypothetical protein
MSRQPSHNPIISIEERNGRIVSIRVRHAGRLPPLPARFTPDVVQRALSLSRTRFEHKVLTAARRLGRVGYRVVERSLILQRCERVAATLVSRDKAGRKFVGSARKAKEGIGPGENKSPPSLTEAWSRKHGLEPVPPQPSQDRGRGR